MSKSPNNGLALLREAISTYLGRVRGIDVSSQQIIISSGAEALYGLIAQYLGKDQTMALEDPSYEQIRKFTSPTDSSLNTYLWERMASKARPSTQV